MKRAIAPKRAVTLLSCPFPCNVRPFLGAFRTVFCPLLVSGVICAWMGTLPMKPKADRASGAGALELKRTFGGRLDGRQATMAKAAIGSAVPICRLCRVVCGTCVCCEEGEKGTRWAAGDASMRGVDRDTSELPVMARHRAAIQSMLVIDC